MRALTPAELLDVWEQGYRQNWPGRAIVLLAAACAELGGRELRDMPVGQRDSLLLTLREWLFGPELAVLASCPACDAAVEATLQTADLRVEAAVAGAVQSIDVDGWRVAFRSPTIGDLLALSAGDDIGLARLGVLSLCVVDTCAPDGATASAAALPDEVIAAVVARMADVDAQANLDLSLTCPECGHRWQMLFDIVSFIWKEIHAWVLRTMRDVHRLARAYGWREADILALSPTRREIYLQLCQP